jgi:hypothetical protein
LVRVAGRWVRLHFMESSVEFWFGAVVGVVITRFAFHAFGVRFFSR